MLWIAMLACTATLQINAPADATVYVTDYPPSAGDEPSYYEAKGTGDTTVDVPYFAWDKFYVWAGGGSYVPEVVRIRNEVKPVPLVVGVLLFWPALLWVSGPEERPIDVKLERGASPGRAGDASVR